jgi:ornithine racemase
MKAFMPRIEINIPKILGNAQMLTELYGKKGISLMGVTKATLGDPLVTKAMIQGGVKFIADSRIENIIKMKKVGISIPFVLLRTALSQAESVVSHVDISLNTEIKIIRALSSFAKEQKKTHKIILMIEMGELREGINPVDLPLMIKNTLALPNIQIIGIGTNLACLSGIKPDPQNMNSLSEIAQSIERDFKIKLEIVSGGNSANYKWFQSAQKMGMINNLRIGESILLGRETIKSEYIPGLYTDAFRLFAEVIELKDKPSLPFGEISQNAFGETPVFIDRGTRQRAIIALGRQDVLVSGIKPETNMEILGSSSDHIVLDSQNCDLKVGEEIKFTLDYGSLLSAMTSPFIRKQYIN